MDAILPFFTFHKNWSTPRFHPPSEKPSYDPPPSKLISGVNGKSLVNQLLLSFMLIQISLFMIIGIGIKYFCEFSEFIRY